MAVRIYEKLGSPDVAIHDIAETNLSEMMNYRNLIMGIPTWGIGEMQSDWLPVLSLLKNMDLTGKTVALFGLGDQESYPDTFGDAVGRLYDVLLETGCSITGTWNGPDYNFDRSKALREDGFVGLLLDEDNQADRTETRIKQWLKTLHFA